MAQKTSQRAGINSKYNKSVLILLVFFMFVVFVFSCDIFTPQPEAGSRNYVWELDTLDMSVNYISTVWGASPDDVWAMGKGGTEYDRLMHYDGNEWSTYTNEIIWCSGSKLFGFSEDDIWMGGGAGWLEHGAGIWHYDGNTWQQFYVYDPRGDYRGAFVDDLWGNSPDEVYASGTIGYYDGCNSWWRGFLLYYNGEEWTEVLQADFNSQFSRVRKEKENVYVRSYAMVWDTLSTGQLSIGYGDREFYKLSSDSSLQKIASYNETETCTNLNCIDNIAYFTINNNICEYKNNKFVSILQINDDNFCGHVAGRSKNDLFIAMKNGIAHYNGEDVEYLYYYPNNRMIITGDPCILEGDIYYSILNGESSSFDDLNLVLHGKLVEE